MSASLIRQLNDAFRTTGRGGKTVMTCGIAALSPDAQLGIMRQVRAFNDFPKGDDPYGEHDFGAFDYPGVGKVFWKIDYYDLSMEFGSENPADPTQTCRLLTIMLAEEY